MDYLIYNGLMDISPESLILPSRLNGMVEGSEWTRADHGLSESSTFRISGAETFYLKVCPEGSYDTLEREKDVMLWLRGRVSVPETVYYRCEGGFEYLLMTEIPGLPGHDRGWSDRLSELTHNLARSLHLLHRVDILSCPFDQSTDNKISLARERLERGLVNESAFEKANKGRTGEKLFEELLMKSPLNEDLVFTHGDLCLPNVVFDDNGNPGFMDLGRAGVCDRYQDLALASRSLSSNFGEEAVTLFFKEYGLEEVDFSRLEFYILLDEFF